MAKRAVGRVSIATEVASHRGYSAIGTVQQHYRLRPGLDSVSGALEDVVLTPGSKGTYVFPAGRDGVIWDPFNAITVVAGVHDPEVALAQLGYDVASISVENMQRPLLISLAQVSYRLRRRLTRVAH